MLQWTRNIEISEIQGVPKESVEIVERKDYVQGKRRHLCWGRTIMDWATFIVKIGNPPGTDGVGRQTLLDEPLID